MTKPGRLWFKFDLDRGPGARRWEVRHATEDDSALMVNNMGRCIRRGTVPRVILVDPTADQSDQDSTVFHELLHAAWPLGQSFVGNDEEEQHVATLEKRLWPVLHSFGLRWPDRKARR